MALLTRVIVFGNQRAALENFTRLFPLLTTLSQSLKVATSAAVTPEQLSSSPGREDDSPPPSSYPSLSKRQNLAEALVLEEKKWSKLSRRTGLIALKLGMTQLWDKKGHSFGVTALQVVDNQVVMIRTKENEGYYGLQIGAIDQPKLKNVLKPVLGQFKKAGVSPKKKLMEFRVTQDALLPVGSQLYASHFIPGQFVDVCSKSIGKGFQGVMKRHHMKGQSASHGTTKTHRKLGATGGGTRPGRIMPGKKMPGRMGGKRVTTKCLKVVRINYRFNVIYVKGPVPGHTNTYVRITDTKVKPNPKAPFPTSIPNPLISLPEEVYSEDVHLPHEGTIVFEDTRKQKKRKK